MARFLFNRSFLLEILSLLLLVAAVVRLVHLDVREWESIVQLRERLTGVPPVGSLIGIDTTGSRVDVESADSVGALLFVVRAEHLAADVRYWNTVVQRVGPAAKLTYWGVCDSGVRCNGGQPGAEFVVVSHLDPYQMHISAAAYAQGQVLLYGTSGLLTERLKPQTDPAAFADTIRGHAR